MRCDLVTLFDIGQSVWWNKSTIDKIIIEERWCPERGDGNLLSYGIDGESVKEEDLLKVQENHGVRSISDVYAVMSPNHVATSLHKTHFGAFVRAKLVDGAYVRSCKLGE